jgi:cytochrome c-type biogenesis protein CcmH
MRRLIIAVLCLLPVLATAREAAPLADDPALEQRVMTLSAELRCLVCQNQSLADSHADLLSICATRCANRCGQARATWR